MKKIHKFGALLLVFIIFSVALVGCSSKTSNVTVNDSMVNEVEADSQTASSHEDTEDGSKKESLSENVEKESQEESMPIEWEIDDEDKSIRGKIGDYIKIPDIRYVHDDDFLEASYDFSCTSSDNSIVEPYDRYSGREVYLKHPGTATITMSMVANKKDGASVDCGSQEVEIIVEEPTLGNEPYISTRNGKFLKYNDNLYFKMSGELYFNSFVGSPEPGHFLYDLHSERTKEMANVLKFARNYNVYNDTIYYTESDDVYAMDVTGDNIRKIGEDSNDSHTDIENMHIIDGNLYYISSSDGDGHIECMSLDGEILKESSYYKNISDMQYYEGSLYFNAHTDNNKNTALYKTDLDFNEVEVVCDDLYQYKLHNGNIYYINHSNHEEKNGIYKYDISAGNYTMIVQGLIGSFDILEDKIFYSDGYLLDTYSMPCYNKIGYCHVDGSQQQFFEYGYRLGDVYSIDDKVYIFSSEDSLLYVFNSTGELIKEIWWD